MTPDWRLIEQEIVGLTVHTAALLGEGWMSRAYLVNEDLVFKCPKRAGDWNELNREVAFLGWAADRLPLPVPEYLHLAPQSHAAPNGYAVYRCVGDEPLNIEALTSRERDATADRIAAFLRQLHLLRPDTPLAELLPRSDALAEARECFERAMAAVVPNLGQEETHALRRQLDLLMNTVHNTKEVIIHADFSREHILSEDGVVAGVIDFGDVSWGDADYDFHYLFLDFGESFTENVGRRYGHANLDELRAKIHLYALADQLETVLNEEGRALPGQVEAATLRVKGLLRSQTVWFSASRPSSVSGALRWTELRPCRRVNSARCTEASVRTSRRCLFLSRGSSAWDSRCADRLSGACRCRCTDSRWAGSAPSGHHRDCSPCRAC